MKKERAGARTRKKKEEENDAMREPNADHTTVRGKTPLMVRGSLPRVFLSLGIFIEADLLFGGSYLLADARPAAAGRGNVFHRGRRN